MQLHILRFGENLDAWGASCTESSPDFQAYGSKISDAAPVMQATARCFTGFLITPTIRVGHATLKDTLGSGHASQPIQSKTFHQSGHAHATGKAHSSTRSLSEQKKACPALTSDKL